MRELTVIGLSDDGASLMLGSTDGARFSVPLDDRLDALVRRDRSRHGVGDVALEGTSPKDIQQRIRHGQSPEDISLGSEIPMERVLRFAGPVIAERQHIASQARAVEIRDAGGDRTLEDAVILALTQGGADIEALEWDAWRRDDGRWSLLVSWDPVDSVADGATAALWTYDPAGRMIQPDDPASAWIIGDRRIHSTIARANPSVDNRGRPLLTAVPSETDAWTDDLDDHDAAITAIVERDSGAQILGLVDLSDRPPAEPDDITPLDDLFHTMPGLVQPEPRRGRRKPTRRTPAAEGDVEKGSKSRASVPSWDEILFGKGQQPDP